MVRGKVYSPTVFECRGHWKTCFKGIGGHVLRALEDLVVSEGFGGPVSL